MRASLANAVRAMNCEGAKSDATKLLRAGCVAFRCFGKAQAWLQGWLGRYHLTKMHEPLPMEWEEWLSELKKTGGVYIVRLKGIDKDGSTVDHCVAIDANRGIVLDSCERNCLRMGCGVLQACLGDGVTLECVNEVRRVVLQNKSSGNRKSRKNPHWRSKRRGEKKRKREESEKASELKKSNVKKVVESDDE